ncbi:MAG: outer membrane protein assembly factor BamA [Aquificaceae bacterium]|nr:outer membrane protein assembly factor BamA [Aquificaceae bacterium]MDW8236811.1 outer membrane protein assembly factor BamA [Aquificaceae bacterium]
MLVLVLLNVSLARTIAGVKVEGNRFLPDDAVLGLFDIKVGSEYNAELIRESVRRAYKSGLFDKIEVYEKTEDARVFITFLVSDLPVIYKIEFQGNRKIKRDELEKRIGVETEAGKVDPQELIKGFTSGPAIEERLEIQRRLRLGRVLSFEELEVLRRRIIEAYAKEGYQDTSVRYELVQRKGASKVVFYITEGQPSSVGQVTFRGNKSFSSSKLLSLMQIRNPNPLFLRFSTPFSEEVLKEDVAKLQEFYRSEGFLEARVSYSLSKTGNTFSPVIEIEEGPRYKLGEVSFSGVTLFGKRELVGRLLDTNPGGFYRKDVVSSLVSQVKSRYNAIGFARANVAEELKIDPEKKKVDIRILVEEGEPVYVQRIDIQGNYETRDYVIRRELRVQEGELYIERDISRSKSRVFNLGYYQDIVIEPFEFSPKGVDLSARVRERFTGQFSVGLGYNQITGISGFVSLRKGNFLGMGDIASVSLSYGGKYRDNSVSYTRKWFLRKPFDLSGTIFDKKLELDTYTVVRTGAEVSLSRELAEFWRVSFGLNAQRVEYSRISPLASILIRQQEGERQSRKFFTTISRDTRDNYLFPTQGSFSEASYSVGVGLLGGDEKFNKLVLSHQSFLKDRLLHSGFVFSIKGLVGIAEPYDNKVLPLDERFFVGGDFSVRGYKYGFAGPVDPNTLEPIGSKKQFFVSGEMLRPFYKNLVYGAVFYDVGLGFNSWEELKTQNLRGGYGAGLRFITPLAPIKIDYAFKTKKVPGDVSRSRIHFVLGLFF